MTATQSAGIALFALWVHGAMAQPFIQPVDAPCISSPFGPRYISNHPEASGLHRGLDFPAPEGAPVWATAAGVVLKVQNKWPGGLEVLIKHNGFISIYSHLGSVSHRIILGKTPVVAGELVGYVGHTGFAFGPHLYFGIVHDGFPIDPAQVFGLPRCADQMIIASHRGQNWR